MTAMGEFITEDYAWALLNRLFCKYWCVYYFCVVIECRLNSKECHFGFQVLHRLIQMLFTPFRCPNYVEKRIWRFLCAEKVFVLSEFTFQFNRRIWNQRTVHPTHRLPPSKELQILFGNLIPQNIIVSSVLFSRKTITFVLFGCVCLWCFRENEIRERIKGTWMHTNWNKVLVAIS